MCQSPECMTSFVFPDWVVKASLSTIGSRRNKQILEARWHGHQHMRAVSDFTEEQD